MTIPSTRRADDVPLAMRVVDTHTEGEPTRVIVDGWPQPAGATMAARRDDLRARFDHHRRAVVCEPRGHDAVVGALLTSPVDPASAAGIVFFNTGTYLGMCGHGLIGVVRALEYLGRLGVGHHRFDTPVGTVSAELAADGTVTIENVPARLHARDVSVDVPGYGPIVGDVAYGGNWFFITHAEVAPLALAHVRELTRFTQAVREALSAAGVTGTDGAEIDHVEVSAPPTRADADARNYVLCSGGDYDRSPCGTGTSATMAALHARGRLAIGERWRQESITGSLFTGWLTQEADGALVPHVRGTAYVTGVATLHFDPRDPFRCGFGGP
jgi:4-hydroxyproline epimerase